MKFMNILHFNYIAKPLRRSARHLLLVLGIVSLSVNLTACGGSGSSSLAADNGEVIIGLTDAPGDFQTYTVDVVSLTLTKANGEVVETLPVKTTVDFSQYTEMTEFLTAATIPSGVYVKGSMVLDYTNANIQVEDAAGITTPVTLIKDEDGNDVSVMELRVQLEGRSRLLIVPGIPASLTLDFDLKASNQVSFDDAGVPTVIVEPFLIADVNLDKNKIHRLRGAVKTVNVAEQFYSVAIRPFHHRLSNKGDKGNQIERFGSLKIHTNDETIFDIDQTPYLGNEGLQQLATMPTFTATVAIGEIKFLPRRFEATHVYAGTSVAGGDMDVVHGNVIARVANSLTVKGATLIRADGTVIFRDTVTVQIADTTIVSREQSMGTYTIDDISVGQRVGVFGTLTNENPDNLELDASNGHINMQFTHLRGNAIVTDGLSLNADLQAIDHREIALFDFTGTGASPAEDADPMNYEIDTAALDISSINDGAPIKARGFVRPFGQAPADFDARTITDVSLVRGRLSFNWDPATTSPFVDLSVSGMTLNLDGQGMFHYIVRAGVRIDMNSLTQNTVIQPLADGAGIYTLHIGDVVELFTVFDNYVDALNSQITAGKAFKGVRAVGLFDAATGIMKAGVISIRVM